MVKKFKKQMKQFIGANVMLGVGSQVIGGLGGSQVPITKAAGMMPAVGAAIGSSSVMRIVSKKSKRRKRRR